MIGNSTLVIAPAVEPVSVDELRAHLRLDSTADDTYLADLITGAREFVEGETRRALVEQTWALFLDRIPQRDVMGWWDGVREGAITMESARSIELPISPLVSVDHVKYYSDDNVATVWPSTNYHVDTASKPGRLSLRTSGVWPVFTRPTNGLEIQYKAGHGSQAGDVPAALRQAIKIIAADWYENRESVIIGTISSRVENSVGAILEKYKIMRL